MNEFKMAARFLRSEERKPSPWPWPHLLMIIFAIVIGTIGGAVFWKFRLPLPWMLGAMFFCMLAAFARLPAALPLLVRRPTMVIIGVMLGATFRPEALAQLAFWWPSFLGMAILLVVAASLNVFYLHRIAGFDRTTAYFAGIPGGLAEMVAIGSERGGDAVAIALLHSARILLVVFSVSFLLDAAYGIETAAQAAARVSILDTSLAEFAWFAFCAIVGLYGGRLLRLPGHVLVGPMLVSAAVHIVGASHFVPPIEIMGAAQVVLGASIGLSFIGVPMRQVAQMFVVSLGSVVLLIALAAAAAWVVMHVFGLKWALVMLAYAPGGLAEMSVAAMALGFDVAFVAAHHVIRIILIVLCAPLAETWLRRR